MDLEASEQQRRNKKLRIYFSSTCRHLFDIQRGQGGLIRGRVSWTLRRLHSTDVTRNSEFLFPLARDGQLLRRQIVRRRVGNISTVGDWGWLYRDNVHGLRGANIVIFECIVHKAINPVCTTCITNAGLLPVVEKRKGSFFSVRKWRMEKGKG